VSSGCVRGPTIDKPKEFGLVSMNRVSEGVTAYLLRAYDPVRHNRITLKIFRGTNVIARMDMAPPLTIDNFEGITSVAGANGTRRSVRCSSPSTGNRAEWTHRLLRRA
jgi:hypothetical protein